MNEGLRDETKEGYWLSRKIEDNFRRILFPCVPRWLETYHLTLCTLIWSFGVIVAGYLAQFDIRWLWLSSIMIVCQYITDLLDGTIGRLRNTGLIYWGYYMDHFLDYVFFTSLILSYAYLLPDKELIILMIIALVQIGFMINIFLSFPIHKKLSIAFLGVGPTEIRILYILFNIYLIYFGFEGPVFLMPYFAITISALLVINVFITQKAIWAKDIENKSQNITAL